MDKQHAPDVSVLPEDKREQQITQLVRSIRGGDETLFPDLWKHVERLCAWYCRRLYKQLPRSFLLEYDDLFDSGFIALHDAVKHYDLERGGRFSLYYLFYLTGAIYRENGLNTGGNNADGTRRFDPSIAGDTVRIDANMDERVEKPGTLAEVLSSESVEHASMDTIAAADERIFYAQLHDTLEALIEKLPAKEQFLIRQKYYAEKTRKRIAQELCISTSAAMTLEDRALVNLRQLGRAAKLDQFLDARTDFYKGSGWRRFQQTHERSTERLTIRRLDLEARYYGLIVEDGKEENGVLH